MKITDIKTYLVEAHRRNWVFIEVETEDAEAVGVFGLQCFDLGESVFDGRGFLGPEVEQGGVAHAVHGEVQDGAVGAFEATGEDDVEESGLAEFSEVLDNLVVTLEAFGEGFEQFLF